MTGTIKVYDRLAAEYLEMMEDAPEGLSAFIAACPPGGRVLDLGCGPGHHARAMAQAGLDVLAVDGSAEMVALAERLPGVNARVALFDDIPTLGPVVGIWASFSLLHAPRDDLPRHLGALHGISTPGAPIALGMKLGADATTDRLGRYYCYYSRDDLDRHLQDAGFTPQNAVFGSGKGLAGDVSDWVVISAHA